MIGHDASTRLTICVAAQNVGVCGWGAALFATLHEVWNIWVGAFADLCPVEDREFGSTLVLPCLCLYRGLDRCKESFDDCFPAWLCYSLTCFLF